jgi:hypothetical protein
VVDFVEGQILFNRPEAAAPGPGCTPLKEVFLVDGGDLEYEINSSDTDSNDSSMYDENCNSCNILNNDFKQVLEEDYDDIYYFL